MGSVNFTRCNFYIHLIGDEDCADKLTNQQSRILRLTRGGMTAKEIAKKLNISINTVNSHKSRINSKKKSS